MCINILHVHMYTSFSYALACTCGSKRFTEPCLQHFKAAESCNGIDR